MGSALYWMGADMHGPRYGWSMHQASAMLLVLDINHLKERIKPLAKYPFSVHPNVVLIILMASLLPMLASIGFIVWQVHKVRSRIKGFIPMAKLLLGDNLQNPKLNEETAQQILSLI